jgi:hypothetical protein
MVTAAANDADRFGIGAGRPRPPYKPRAVTCAHCGAGLQIKDERAQLVVCDYCGSRLNVTAAEAKVLGSGPGRKPDFPLALGARFLFKGAKYEVIARMRFIEDDDESEQSLQYLLYHPRRGTLYLDEYQGDWSISWPTHVMPTSDALAMTRGRILRTHDNRSWVTDGTGTYELKYVDGALPWIANVGDKIRYAEFSEKSGSGLQYEAEAQGDEIEYGTGQSLSADAVRRAMGASARPAPGAAKPSAPAFRASPALDAAQMRNWYLTLIVIALAIAGLSFLAYAWAAGAGRIVLQQSFGRAELTGQKLSDSFHVAGAGGLIRVRVEAPALDNEWMAVDLAVVEGEDNVLYDFDSDVSYYHGVEDGESWSEGSHADSHYIEIPKAGDYRLLVHAVGAAGETENAQAPPRGLNLTVTAGAVMDDYFLYAGIFALVVFGILVYAFFKWRSAEAGDDD